MTTDEKGDYETRDVDYSLIHGETKDVFLKFTQALELRAGSRLLDVGGGYGSVLIHILENDPQLNFHYDLLDSSQHQIKKAKHHIAGFLKGKTTNASVSYIHQSAAQMNLPAGHYDVVICKMFIHEVPEHEKEMIFTRLFSVLKPGGRVLFWMPDLDENDHAFYIETIRKKDELARFNELVKNRHFLLNSELVTHLERAGFSSIEKLFHFNYDLHTSRRLKDEFKNRLEDLEAWNLYILKIAELLTPGQKQDLLVDIREDNIHIRFKRAVFKAVKA